MTTLIYILYVIISTSIFIFLYSRLKKYKQMIKDLLAGMEKYSIAINNYKKAINNYDNILKQIYTPEEETKSDILDKINIETKFNLDNILDKLSKFGINSLSKEELNFLKSKSKSK